MGKKIIGLALILYLIWVVVFYQPWNYERSYLPTEVSIGEKIAKHATEGGYLIPKQVSLVIKENVLSRFNNAIKDALLVDLFYFIDGKLSEQRFDSIIEQAKKHGFSINDKIGAQRNNSLEIAMMSHSCRAVKKLIQLGASPEIDILKKDASRADRSIELGLKKIMEQRSKVTYQFQEDKIKSEKDMDCIVQEYQRLGFKDI